MKKFFPDDSAFPVFHGTTAERTALLVSEPGLLVGTRFIEDTGAVNIVGSIVGSVITWLGPYTAADVGLGGGGGDNVAPSTYNADKAVTAVSVSEVIPSGATNVLLSHVTGAGVCRVMFGTNAVVAESTKGPRIPPGGTPIVLDVPTIAGAIATHWAYIAEGGTATLAATWG
jgi:hypothetical protein